MNEKKMNGDTRTQECIRRKKVAIY